MANIKSQKKRNITNEVPPAQPRHQVRAEDRHPRCTRAVCRRRRNRCLRQGLYACRLLDKAVSKGVIHKNQAANRKSGVMALVNTIVTDEVRAAYVKPEAKAGGYRLQEGPFRKAEGCRLQGCRRGKSQARCRAAEARGRCRRAQGKKAAEAAAAELRRPTAKRLLNSIHLLVNQNGSGFPEPFFI